MKFFGKKPAQPDVTNASASSDNPANQTTIAPTNTQPNLPPTPSEPSLQTTAPAKPTKKRKWTLSLVSTLFVLTLMAVAVVTYMWHEQKTRADGLVADVSEAKWVADDLREKLDDIKLTQAKSEDDAIRQAVRRFKNALVEPGDYDVTVDIRRGDFSLASYVTANKENDEYCYLKKVGASWVLLTCKRSPLTTQEMKKWDVPEEIDPAKVTSQRSD